MPYIIFIHTIISEGCVYYTPTDIENHVLSLDVTQIV